MDRFPLALGYLAGAIKNGTDWDVMVYNADFSASAEFVKVSYLSGIGFENYQNNLKVLSGKIWKEVCSAIEEYRPSVIGISSKSQNFASAYIVAKIAKEIDKHIMIVMGGSYPSMAEADLLEYPEIDVCVKGEGEETIVELLNDIDSDGEFDGINGIIYRKNGHIVENPSREYILDIDSLCFPHEIAPGVLKDYDQYPVSAFKNIYATRGCPHNCFFCGSREVWGRKARFRSPGNVIEEIKGLQKMGLKCIHFDDDTFGINRKYLLDLCKSIILHCPGLRWSCELRVDLVDEQTVSIMKEAGCDIIQVGVESGNNEILSAMRKGITVEEALAACEIIRNQGIELQTFFMVGFPQETEKTLQDTVDVMKKTKSRVLLYSIFTPYPYTEAFEFCKEKGLVRHDYDISLYNHQSPANCFCMNIPPERFRMVVRKIEKMVDRRNGLNHMKRIFDLTTFARIQDLGFGRSIWKGAMVFLGK